MHESHGRIKRTHTFVDLVKFLKCVSKSVNAKFVEQNTEQDGWQGYEIAWYNHKVLRNVAGKLAEEITGSSVSVLRFIVCLEVDPQGGRGYIRVNMMVYC